MPPLNKFTTKAKDAIKKAHPYEETVIDIYPIYEIARKKGS